MIWWLVTNLPKRSMIPVLTNNNRSEVARLHLEQLASGTAKEPVTASKFVLAALQECIKDSEYYQQHSRERLRDRDAILKFVPHVRVAIKRGQEELLNEWFEKNDITYYRCCSNPSVWVFDTWENAILFKLRWTGKAV